MKSKRAIEIQNSIRQILFYDWDPININDNLNLVDEYDAYIVPVYRILVGSRSEKAIINIFLSAEEKISDESTDISDRLKLIAEKLLKLNVKI